MSPLTFIQRVKYDILWTLLFYNFKDVGCVVKLWEYYAQEEARI